MIEPIRVAFDVDCDAQDAFDLWTQRSSSWWPAAHTVSADPGVRVIFEARPGGRIRDYRSDATEVEIRFLEQPSGGTRVEIEHRGWERLGGRGRPWRRVNLGGWDGVLPAYRDECRRVSRSRAG